MVAQVSPVECACATLPLVLDWLLILGGIETMMLATVQSSVLQVVGATLVDVEIDLGRGLPQLSIVGLPCD
jgi:hypothetical protein